MKTNYTLLLKQLKTMLAGETDQIACLSNTSALINDSLENINWAGFYLYKKETDALILGPFQGKVACVHIPMGKGVCGTAAYTLATQLVPDVHKFPGHIACDSASESEIVVPIVVKGALYGVLDIDAPIKSRFNETDKKHLEEFVKILSEHFSSIL